ncbi:rho GTPase-activating protein 33-like [Pogoniulus pusillus]|uniref:rho GTPase-activating protein 33-like n=1 Tax=Pogoniulus pusillus TaxID=488313 RepID=UPI0030B92E28
MKPAALEPSSCQLRGWQSSHLLRSECRGCRPYPRQQCLEPHAQPLASLQDCCARSPPSSSAWTSTSSGVASELPQPSLLLLKSLLASSSARQRALAWSEGWRASLTRTSCQELGLLSLEQEPEGLRAAFNSPARPAPPRPAASPSRAHLRHAPAAALRPSGLLRATEPQGAGKDLGEPAPNTFFVEAQSWYCKDG